VIDFHLNARSGVSPYLQLVQQVRQAMRLGLLREGDRLPTVKEVVGRLALNPNTVLKAYRELEREGLVEGRAGVGTFVLKRPDGPPPPLLGQLRRSLDRWLRTAFEAGLDHESIASLFESGLRDALIEEEETA